MKVVAFRIKNFRSIADTGWCAMSPDGVTVFVGQNESGKTSVLDALSMTISFKNISSDDLRFGSDLPSVELKLQISESDRSALIDSVPEYLRLLRSTLKECDVLTLRFSWVRTEGTRDEYEGKYSIVEPPIRDLAKSEISASMEAAAAEAIAAEVAEPIAAQDEQTDEDNDDAVEDIDDEDTDDEEKVSPLPKIPSAEEVTGEVVEEIRDAFWEQAPDFVLFNEQTGLLPSKISVNTKYQLEGNGSDAAKNFLQVAEVDLEQLVKSDNRVRGNILRRANERISADFNSFWSQTIGEKNSLQLECQIGTYGNELGTAKAGTAYLEFWISDGNNQLYPHQRSKGTTWFVSFYLQLKASAKKSSQTYFLLDEPGSNLHEKAQRDVLSLINKMSSTTQLAYSTHSPHLVEYEKLYRIIAVQREGEKEESPTVLIAAHQLTAASSETLSPILTAMGADLSRQQVVQKTRNVLLEELSAHYYLRAFWLLTNTKESAHFMAATGVSNVPLLAQLFLGWGLEFISIFDDDSHGRSVYNQMKRDLYGDESLLAQKKMYKIENCGGIEDVFSPEIFFSLVTKANPPKDKESPAAWAKKNGAAKAVIAMKFMLSVQKGEVSLADLDEKTKEKITDLVGEIVKRLNG